MTPPDDDLRPLPWSRVLPEERRSRLAASTKAALRAPEPPRWRPQAWVPAAALAGAALFFALRPLPPAPARPDQVPAEVLEKWELLENLEVLENWEEVQRP